MIQQDQKISFTWVLAGLVVAYLIFRLGVFPVVLLCVIGLLLYQRGVLDPVLSAIVTSKKTMDSNTININPNMNIFRNARRMVGGVVIFIALLILFFQSVLVVRAGHVGVYELFGKVSQDELMPGLHLINPLAKVIQMSTQTEEFTMSVVSNEGAKQGNDAISALTKEGLQVDLDITVLYHLEQHAASDIYNNVGLTYVTKIIRPEIRSVIREVIAEFEAKDIYSNKRQEAAQKIALTLTDKLAPRGIALEDVLLRNVELPKNLAQSIQEKLQAEQEAQKYDFVLEKEQKEAERKRIEAQGQRDAQSIINESLTTNYLYFRYISELQQREGTVYVPISPSTGLPLFRNLGN